MKSIHYTLSFFLLSALLCLGSCKQQQISQVLLNGTWRFNPGDDMNWANTDMSDTIWNTISTTSKWEDQGYTDLNGYAWYRTHFTLPSAMIRGAYFPDTVVIQLGKIDDEDQVFLNGQFVGANNRTYPAGTPAPDSIDASSSMWDIPRVYSLSADDPRLNLDGDNLLAVRVYDGGGGGGILAENPMVRMKTLDDYVTLDLQSDPFRIEHQTTYHKTIFLNNTYPGQDFEGKLEISVINNLFGSEIYHSTKSVHIPSGTKVPEEISFVMNEPVSCYMNCQFTPEIKGEPIYAETGVPYILTPPVSGYPKIHTPAVYGARPGHPFLYRIPVTGEAPVSVAVNGLPGSLRLQEDEHVITGITPGRGIYPVRIIADNELGQDTVTLIIKAGKEIALTPPLGWNSWNVWGLSVDDAKVRAAADAFVETGLADHGWSYINIDDGWERDERLPNGAITGNEKFPDFRGLSGYVHSKGLKLGIYSGPGPLTCGGFLASYGHEYQDAATWAAWGIDYLKYDWCSYGRIAPDNSLPQLQKPYILMRRALDAVSRDIVYSLCQYGMGDVWKWGTEVGGNLWRTTGDIRDTWSSLHSIGFRQYEMSPYASPGHWNDPDMLVVGWVGWGPNLHPTQLTPDEQYTHISLWSLLSAPLLIGCDLTRLDPFTLSLLTNDEVLAVNQDELGKQADKVFDHEDIQYWIKETYDGYAAGIFNLTNDTRTVDVTLEDLGIEGSFTVRDLWRQKDMGVFSEGFTVTIPAHGVMLVRLKPTSTSGTH